MIHGFMLYLPRVVGMTLGSAALTLVLRGAGPEPFGAYSVAVAYWSLLSLLGSGAIAMSTQTLLASAHYDGSRIRSATLLQTAFVWTLGLSVVTGLLGAALYPTVTATFFPNSGIEHFLWGGFAVYVGVSMLTFFRFALRGLHMFGSVASMDIIESLGRSVIWLTVAGAALTAGSLLWGHALALLFSVLAAVFFTRHLLIIGGDNRRVASREVLNFSAPFVQILFLNYIFSSFSTLALGYYRSSEEVGVYSGLYRIVEFFNGPLIALGSALAPTVSGLVQQGPGRLDELLTKSFRLVVLFLPVIMLVSVNALPIFRIFFGGAFERFLPVIHIFSIFMVFNAISSFFGLYLDHLGLAAQRATLMACIAVLHVIGCSLAARYWGVVGVAAVSTGMYAVLVLGYLWTISEHHSFSFLTQNLPVMAKVVVAMVPAYAICLLMPVEPVSLTLSALLLGIVKRSALFCAFAAAIFFICSLRRRGERLAVEFI